MAKGEKERMKKMETEDKEQKHVLGQERVVIAVPVKKK